MFSSKEFCFIVDNPFRVGDEHELFFQCPAEDVTVLPETATMLDVLVQTGVFSSKTQARKDPKWGKNLEIPEGFTHWDKLGKRRNIVSLFRPMEFSDED